MKLIWLAAAVLAALWVIAPVSIDVIYNPGAEPRITPEATREVEQGWPATAPRILTVGSLNAAKNHRLLIEAFALLRRSRSAQLMILGQGDLRGELEALVAARGLAGDVVFPGFFTNPWPFYASAQVFALSSDYEGYPLVLIEAMRSGLSVVSTDCESGPREILDGGTYGRLVPCGDPAALAQAMADALDRPTDAAILRDRAQALSGQDTSDRYLALMTGRSKVI